MKHISVTLNLAYPIGKVNIKGIVSSHLLANGSLIGGIFFFLLPCPVLIFCRLFASVWFVILPRDLESYLVVVEVIDLFLETVFWGRGVLLLTVDIFLSFPDILLKLLRLWLRFGAVVALSSAVFSAFTFIAFASADLKFFFASQRVFLSCTVRFVLLSSRCIMDCGVSRGLPDRLFHSSLSD